MKKLTPFKIGLSLMIIGSIWVALAFSTAEKTSNELNIGTKESSNVNLDLKNK